MVDDRNQKMLAAYISGNTLRAIGQDFGLTRERVRQIVSRMDPTAKEQHDAARAALRPRVEVEEVEVTCVVCGTIFMSRSRGRICCSKKCSDAWCFSKSMLDPFRAECLRIQLVLSVLRHPERHNKWRVSSARHIVEGIKNGELIQGAQEKRPNMDSKEAQKVIEALGSREKAEERIARTLSERSSPEIRQRVIEWALPKVSEVQIDLHQ